MTQLHTAWLVAIVLVLLAPFSLLFGVDVWRVVVVFIVEFMLASLITWWMRQSK